MSMTENHTTDRAAVELPVGSTLEPKSDRRGGPLKWLESYGLVLLFVLLYLFFASFWNLPGTFRSGANIRQVLQGQAVPAILALASIIPLVCGEFDLTVGAVAGLTSMTVAGAVTDHHAGLGLAVVLALGIAVATGVLSGVLVAYVGVNSFISTLGVGIAINGLMSWYTNNSILIGNDSTLASLGSGSWLGIPKLMYFVAIVAALVYYLLEHTPYGRYLRSVGSNSKAARLVGLDVRRMVLVSFILSALLSGIAGILLLGSTGSAQLQGTGTSLTLPALAAAFLGATTIKAGRFNVAGTLIAVYFLAFALSGLTLNGVQAWVQDFFTGTALVFAVALSTIAGRSHAGAAE